MAPPPNPNPSAFSGALPAKKKSELQQIANALGLSDQGTKDDLLARIKRHLDAHQRALEDDPVFAGLYARRRRSVQPQPLARRQLQLRDAVKEASPEDDDDDEDTGPTTPSSLPPLPPSPAVVVAAPAAPAAAAAVLHVGASAVAHVLENSTELLLALRAFLSNSRNIWSVTSVFELLYILAVAVPWQSLHITTAGAYTLALPYPPLAVFSAPAFWQTLLQWAVPTLILPALLGRLISFNPALAPSTPAPLDPLTASIIRLAAQTIYPFPSPSKGPLPGLAVSHHDVLGQQWRVLSASVGLAFAFAEAVGGTPGDVARVLAREHPVPQPQPAESKTLVALRPQNLHTPVRRRALMGSVPEEEEGSV